MSAPRNLIRHSGVPPAVFARIWTTLKAGRPWMGIVKNRCRNGDHYWVSAYITSIYGQGMVVDHESVRVKPIAGQIQRAEALYRRLGVGKPTIPRRNHRLPMLFDWLSFTLISQTGFLIGIWLNSWWGFILADLLAVPLGLAGLRWQKRGLKRLVWLAERTASDPLIAQMYTDNRGEQARLEVTILSQDVRPKTCLTRLQDTAEYLTEQARRANTLVHHNSVGLEQQRAEIEQAATVVNEMAATAQEVTNNAQLTVDATQKANEPTSRGRDVAAETRNAIQRLLESVGETGATVSRLVQDSNEIGGVVDVIEGIADQISLLALNTAIEATRAGDQGRGFAVVADEMRSLAQHIVASAKQAYHLIVRSRNTASDAAHTTESDLQQAEVGVQRVLEASSALVDISEAVSNIIEMAIQVAATAGGQSAVAKEINRNVGTIAALAEQTSDEALRTVKLSGELTATTQSQYSLVEYFNC